MINEHYAHLKPAQIAYVMKQRDPDVDPKPPKQPRMGKQRMAARARLVPQLYRLLTGYDFIIEADEVLWDMLLLEQQEAVVDHELCHCARDENGWYIRDHDVQEFAEIIERHGLYHRKLEEFISAAHQQGLPFEAQAAAGT
jgi:hypothetical protein